MKEMWFGNYIVRKESNNFYGIYNEDGLITHRTNWNNACRVAKLLDQAYNKGREDYGSDINGYYI